jgi:hypothetical protein
MEGDLLSPVKGAVFDLVIFNLPFFHCSHNIPSRDCVIYSARYIFRDY